MTILVVSDSHRLEHELREIVQRHRDEVTTFLHCGDSELDETNQVLVPFHVVKGNCDFFGDFPKLLVVEADGLRICLVHGHYFDVKSSLFDLQRRAKAEGCQVACFGHSHQVVAEEMDGVLMVNPGSIRLPRGRRQKTYVIMRHVNGEIEVCLHDLSGELLESSQFNIKQ